MKLTQRIALTALSVLSCMFVYWVYGGVFERGVALGGLTVCTYCAALYVFLATKY